VNRLSNTALKYGAYLLRHLFSGIDDMIDMRTKSPFEYSDLLIEESSEICYNKQNIATEGERDEAK